MFVNISHAQQRWRHLHLVLMTVYLTSFELKIFFLALMAPSGDHDEIIGLMHSMVDARGVEDMVAGLSLSLSLSLSV